MYEDGPKLAEAMRAEIPGLKDQDEEAWVAVLTRYEEDALKTLDDAAWLVDKIDDHFTGREMADTMAKVNETKNEVRTAYIALVSGSDPACATPDADGISAAEVTKYTLRIADMQQMFKAYRREEGRLLDKAIRVYDDTVFNATTDAVEALAPINGLYLRWKPELMEYRHNVLKLNDGETDTQRMYDDSYRKFGPSHDRYNIANRYIHAGMAQDYARQIEPY